MRELLSKIKILTEFWKIISHKRLAGGLLLSKELEDFEKKLAEYAGAKYALGVASGTDALILSLKACDIGPGDEVIVPAVSFYSSAGAVAWVNAKPVFVDVSPKDHNLDISKIEKAITSRTKAIIAVHLNGRMADMDEILKIAKNKSLKVIADSSHAIGSSYKNKPVGNFGDLICLSFNFTKTLAAYGDGGAILTNDEKLAQKIYQLRIYGASRWLDIHTENRIIGTASRLGILQAVVLNEKMALLDFNISRQRENYFLYKDLLAGAGDLEWPIEHPDYFINGYRLPVLTAKRDSLINFLASYGEKIYNWYPVPLPYLPAFHNLGYKKGDFPVAEKIARECVILPTRYSLTKEKTRQIANLINKFFH